MDLYNMPIGVFHYLDCKVLREMKDEYARQRKENEIANDHLEESMGMR